MRSNRHHSPTMRTIEIAVNDSAHRCLVLASIFFERPTHDLVALMPSFAAPTRCLIRIIRIRCKTIKPNTSNKTTHGSASAQLSSFSLSVWPDSLAHWDPPGPVRYSGRQWSKSNCVRITQQGVIRHGRFFQITRRVRHHHAGRSIRRCRPVRPL